MGKVWDTIKGIFVIHFCFMLSLNLSYQSSLKLPMAAISTADTFLNIFGDLVLVPLIHRITTFSVFPQEHCEDQHIKGTENLSTAVGRAMQALQKDVISVTCAFTSLTHTCNSLMTAYHLILDVFLL